MVARANGKIWRKLKRNQKFTFKICFDFKEGSQESMKRQFVMTRIFDKRWQELGLTDEDLQRLEIYLLENPGSGDIIQGTGGAIKLRWALPNTGKSSSARIIYIDLIKTERVHFITCYQKSKKIL